MDEAIARAGRLLAGADEVLAFVGSGLSAESGVPTFRGEDGLFSDPEVAELARRETLEREPERVLSWFEEGRRRMREVDPNPGHYALARLADRVELTVATQNVDGLLERAAETEGVEFDVHHVHGSLFDVVCGDCGRQADPDVDLAETPTCEACGGMLRPDVVLFGEMLPRATFDAAESAAGRADVCLLIGTSGIVYPAAGLPRQAGETGAELVEINPRESELSGICDVVIRRNAGEAMPAVEEAFG